LFFLSCFQEGKIARARDMFYHAEAHFLLYSERFHFFRRPSIKGILHLVFYQPPTFPHFYSEMCNLMQVRDTGVSLWAFTGWLCQIWIWSLILLRICCSVHVYAGRLSFFYLYLTFLHLILHLFALMPLINLHHFLIYTLSFSVSALWLVYFLLFKPYSSSCNIIFDLRLFELCPIFQEHN
jgi:hypothetical protein